MNKFDKTTLRRIWDTELEIADVIDKFCKEHGLHYSLAYGTMLGAVRHGGFIPWDDDMDIWMLREDYDRFIELWERNPVDGYYLLRQETTPEYPQNFAKIRKCGTAFVSHTEEDTNYHHGIFVDIFPLDNVANNTILAIIQRYCALFYMLYCRGYASTHDGKLMYWGSKILLDVFPVFVKKKLRKFFYRQTVRYNKCNYNALKVASFVTASSTREIFDKRFLQEWTQISFENRMYMCNKDVDSLLKVCYGDYMQLPPEEERVWKHHPVIIDFEHEYWPNEGLMAGKK